MPQFKFMNRRWRTTTDTLPILAMFLTLFHTALLSPSIAILCVNLGSSYTCDQKAYILTAIIGFLVLTALSVVIEHTMVRIGLRGGPFEERKRRLMGPLVYVVMVIVLLNLGFTIYGTYLATSSKVEDQCWNSNPCKSIGSYIPRVCTSSREEQIDLTAACIDIPGNWTLITVCDYLFQAQGSLWLSNAYDENFIPPYNLSYVSTCDINQTDPNSGYWDLLSRIDVDAMVTYVMDDPALSGDFFRNVYSEYFSKIRLPVIGDPMVNVPWANCLDYGNCSILYNSTCMEWGELATVPSSTDVKGLYDALIIIQWVVVLVTIIALLIAFNANSDYTSLESWQKTVEFFGWCMGCSSVLEEATTGDGMTAKQGIGELLRRLFGGIDTDMTDKLLGAYLAGERIRWRRQEQVCIILERHGYKRLHAKHKDSLLWRICCCYRPRKTIDTDKLVANLDDTRSEESVEDDKKMKRAREVSPRASRSRNSLPSPYADVPTSNSLELSDQSTDAPSLGICHSLVRLDTSSLAAIASYYEEDIGKEPSKKSSISRQPSTSLSVVQKTKSRQLLTPLNLAHIKFDPPLPNIEASKIYMASYLPVSKSVLQEALSYSWYAKAAYGLQDKLWKGSKTGLTVVDQIDSMLNRFGKPLSNPLSLGARFKKKNFNAILKFTGLKAEDFLYVSYTSSSFGLVPYMVMLNRELKKVIISIRGTVGAADLLTDLLSNPVDADPILPEWALKEAANLPGDEHLSSGLFAHAGIISSAKSVLDDLEGTGLINAMLDLRFGSEDQIFIRSGSLSREFDDLSHLTTLENSPEDENVRLPLQRARTIVNEAVVKEGWGVVVTGHSLGAAVASLISFRLRESFSTLRCFAFNPPGGLMSPKLSEIAKTFCTSIVVGYDAISRLGLQTVQEFVDDMVFALSRCKRAKLGILWDVLWSRRNDPATAPPTFCSFEDLEPDVLSILQQYIAKSQLHAKDLDTRPLCPPGTIVFLRPFWREHSQVKKRLFWWKSTRKLEEVWDAVYVDACAIMDEGLVITKGAMAHHKLGTMQAALSSAIKNESFEPDGSV